MDQWLYVAGGTGVAVVEGGGSICVRARSCGSGAEAHEIRNTGDTPLKTLGFYGPPGYTDDGGELPAGRAT